jgi:hypothetical protein
MSVEQRLRDELRILAGDARVVDVWPAVQRGVRARYRRRVTSVVATLVVVGALGVAGLPLVHRARISTPPPGPAAPAPSPSSTPTSTPTPTKHVDQPFGFTYPVNQRGLTWTTTLDGLRITTSGPADVVGGTPHGPGGDDGACLPFTVQLIVTNTTATTWAGTVGVGLAGARADPRFGREMLYGVHAGCADPSQYWFEHGASPAHWIQGIADPTRHQIRPGRTIILVIYMAKGVGGSPQVPIQGWIPVLNPIDPRTSATNAQAHYPNPFNYPTVDVA